MTLAKLKIIPRQPSNLEEFEVLFNPSSYSISKSVTWKSLSDSLSSGSSATAETNLEFNAPLLNFGGGNSRVLTLKLFFDVTEPINGQPIKDVRELTNKFVKLTRIERTGKTPQPPICDIRWGNVTPRNSDFPFTGVVTSLDQEFTLFRRTGEPVRANLTVVFTEYLLPETDQRENDPEFTTWMVKRGDTLSLIAAHMYGDPTLWRVLADANNLADPRQLEIGITLNIPKRH